MLELHALFLYDRGLLARFLFLDYGSIAITMVRTDGYTLALYQEATFTDPIEPRGIPLGPLPEFPAGATRIASAA